MVWEFVPSRFRSERNRVLQELISKRILTRMKANEIIKLGELGKLQCHLMKSTSFKITRWFCQSPLRARGLGVWRILGFARKTQKKKLWDNQQFAETDAIYLYFYNLVIMVEVDLKALCWNSNFQPLTELSWNCWTRSQNWINSFGRRKNGIHCAKIL